MDHTYSASSSTWCGGVWRRRRGRQYARGGSHLCHACIDELFRKQDVETDVTKRQAMLHDIQRLAYDRALFVPLYAWVWHSGVGPRVKEASLGKIPLFYYTGPFEDLRLKGQ